MWKSRLILVSFLFSLWALNLSSVFAAETVEYGDVVDVNYSLWQDEEHTIEKEGNIDIDLHYIYLRRAQTEKVPAKVYRALPSDSVEELQQVYLQAFIDAIIEMKVDEVKNFMIAAEDAYGDEDLYYQIKLLTLLYDASAQVSEGEDATDPFKDLYPLLIGGSVAVAGGGLTAWYVHSSRTQKTALSEEKLSSQVREKSILKDKQQIKELRELTESLASSEDTPKKEEVKFRRRR
ncbi:MAG: hypothetical protein ACFFFH_00925 [Candidatus Thorarchaeota archaeon]